jgi:hypothetical protein
MVIFVTESMDIVHGRTFREARLLEPAYAFVFRRKEEEESGVVMPLENSWCQSSY